MKWQIRDPKSTPPRAVILDIIVKGKRRTNYRYMPALNMFRSELTKQQIPAEEVTHWMEVVLPSDGTNTDKAMSLLQEAQKNSVLVLQDGLSELSGQAKEDVSFQLRGVIAHLGKSIDLLHFSQLPKFKI